MTDDETFERWDGWLEKIYKDSQDLLVLRHVFWEVQEIIKANPRIHKPSSFYKWMGATYSAAIAVGIRRQLDERSDVISISRLLAEIETCPHVLSRDRYRAIRKTSGSTRPLADLEFDRFAGKGKPFVDRALVRKDLDKLRAKAAVVKKYTNKAVAHVDEKGPAAVPTFSDIDECLTLLEELVKKYYLVFRAIGVVSVLPTWQYDWKAIFREPWIPPRA
jgi:hypothetical protein